MNKRKMIFIVVLIAVVLIIFMGIFIMQKQQQTDNFNKSKGLNGNLMVWIVGDDKAKFLDFVSDFKKSSSSLNGVSVDVESFPNYEEYITALALSFVVGNSPDIFVLNNNEKSIFSNKIKPFANEEIDPNEFRKMLKGVFPDELITKTSSGEIEYEYVNGVPVGYETLGVFYKRGYFKSKDFDRWDSLSSAISVLKTDYPDFIPIGIGNGSTVYGVSDIITAFFVGKNIFSIENLGKNKSIDVAKQAILGYLLYGDKTFYNSYNSKFDELKASGENNIDLFSKGEVLSIIGYPRMIKEIKDKTFKSNLLLADDFPLFGVENEKNLVNYNYFVINKDTKNPKTSNAFMKYLLTEDGARKYLKKYPYYLPAMLSLEDEKMKENIDPDYNVKLGDFYDKNREYTSFDKGSKTIYDKEIISVLDDQENYSKLFIKFRDSLLCRVKKFRDSEGFGEDCYK